MSNFILAFLAKIKERAFHTFISNSVNRFRSADVAFNFMLNTFGFWWLSLNLFFFQKFILDFLGDKRN